MARGVSVSEIPCDHQNMFECTNNNCKERLNELYRIPKEHKHCPYCDAIIAVMLVNMPKSSTMIHGIKG